jgi:glutamate synthase (NADPH) large chain
MTFTGPPPAEGLYDPRFEHDACGVGFVADLMGRKSHDILCKSIQVLLNLRHRGACGSEKIVGDGAGLLLQLPHRFFTEQGERLGIRLPPAGEYAVGMMFLPTDADARGRCEHLVETIIREEGQRVLGWRSVPVDNSALGKTARESEPAIRQVFVGRSPNVADPAAFERKLYVIRKRAERAARDAGVPEGSFYVASLSHKTIVYKGMLTPNQLPIFYPDLMDPAMETALVVVHSRFSTNTFPSWARAHPYRYLAHNGEINTLRGNVNWMHARERHFASDLFGSDIEKTLPVIDGSGSDSAMFDNALEMLVLGGRSLPHAVMMMIPEPWTGNEEMSADKRAFYEYHACLMEPWDGPASIAFTDGVRVGAVLDRNGLRPSRYSVTKDGLFILASETGVLEVPPDQILHKGRLQPGRMLLLDLEQGRIVGDDELKNAIATAKPYRLWLDKNLVPLQDLPDGPPPEYMVPDAILRCQQLFGYTTEDLRIILSPMAADGNEPLGSMGTDTPLAVLSDRPQLLYNYFKQLFAQVTNPPVDAIREELIMSIDTTIGAEGNLLAPGPESARQIKLRSPILTNEELAKLEQLGAGRHGRFKAIRLPMLFPADADALGLERALVDLCRKASDAIAAGHDILILSDRGADPDNTAIPALLAVAGVHHHLIREGTRTLASLVLESGEPREVHHFALLIGYGASAINPYLAFETIGQLVRQGELVGVEYGQAIKKYQKAVEKGVVKIMSKMGISTVQSYRGAQIFEAIGLGSAIVERYFTGTPSRVGGIGLDVIAGELRARHEQAFPRRGTNGRLLDDGGQYQWRQGAEQHLFNPQTVHKLQFACRTGSYEIFKQYSKLVDDQSERLCTLRGLCELQFPDNPIPLEEVETVDSIVKRFKSGAMSYGSISQEAHETLAIAMNRIGGKSNTGEGGEDPARYTLDPNGDSRNSAIKQIASARFGVTSEYLVMAKELQIKMAQGAKPGEGGQLPGHKVYPWIARVRHSTPGVGLISPPPHHDIYSIEDLAELIHDLKNANHKARISVKLVAEVGVGTIAAGVAKAHADVVLISGHDGGTGASPLTSIKHAGAPWELGLAETHQTLVLNDLRSRITIEVDGQLKTGRDVVIGALLGAEEFGFATAPLVALGCILMRVCHLNTCPVGVATQDPRLRKNFAGDADHVVNFMRFIAQEVRELMARLGFRTISEMVGHTERLGMRRALDHYKTRGLDFSRIFHQPDAPPHVGRYCQISQDHGLEAALDKTTLLEICKPALDEGTPVSATLPIYNHHRVVGTMVGSEVTRRYGRQGLPEDTIRLHFQGSAGQSFGAFVPHGVTLILEGDSNDYLGKGLSGGKIIVYPPRTSTFVPSENVITGNVALYGATGGEAYISGVAGERFCVRNSGALAVVEGIGDHACEYMTGGRVVVLGTTGRNFAAGMSGGIAYVLDESGEFSRRCNRESVGLYPLEDVDEIELVRGLIRRHAEHTHSERAWKTLALWDEALPRFIKVYPNDYRRVLETQKRVRDAGVSEADAEMAAFELNARDLARAGGR